jgi:uridine phosphorylase
MALATNVYHLALSSESIEGATIALLPGDPGRVPGLASTPPFERPRLLASKREFATWIAYIGATPVLVTSTGIGGPSASIAIDELAQLGVRTFLRVGTTGAIQPDLAVGDVVVTTGAVRLDGASTHYAPLEFPAVAHYTLVNAAIQAAQASGIQARPGISASTDTFYPGQERIDSFTGYVPRRFKGATEEWRPDPDGGDGSSRRLCGGRRREPGDQRARDRGGAGCRRAQRGACCGRRHRAAGGGRLT